VIDREITLAPLEQGRHPEGVALARGGQGHDNDRADGTVDLVGRYHNARTGLAYFGPLDRVEGDEMGVITSDSSGHG